MAQTTRTILCIIALIIFTGIMVFVGMYAKPQADINGNRSKMVVDDAKDLERDDCIHFLSTGSSDAILLESNGHYALIDCGEDEDNPRGFDALIYKGYEQEILTYLKANAMAEDGKVHLDFVLGTHSHSDHIGGFDTIIMDEDIVIDRAYLKKYDETRINTHEVEAWDNKEVYEQMVNALHERNVPIISDITKPQFNLGDFDITLFNTEYDDSGELVGENDNAIGTLVEKNGARVFLAADIDNITGDEDRLGPQIGKVDLLKVGHHSYSKSTSTKWLRTLNPTTCVVTNNYEQTDKKTLRRISRVAKSPILVTGKENGVIASIDDNGVIKYYNNIQ